MKNNFNIDTFIAKKERYYSKVFTANDVPSLLKRANQFYSKSTMLKRKNDKSTINWDDKKTVTGYIFRDKCARLFLGIAVELFIKAVYLQNGYVINNFKGVKKNNLEKLEGIKSRDLLPRTQQLSTLIKSLSKVLPQNSYNFDKEIRRGLELARIWRNSIVHSPENKHMTRGDDWILVINSFKIINNLTFIDRQDLRSYLK